MKFRLICATAVLALLDASAHADVLFAPGSVIGDTVGGGLADQAAITNQSGLSDSYVSGVTTIGEADVIEHGNGSADSYFVNKDATVNGVIDFDLQSVREITSLALWNANGGSRLDEFAVFAATDQTFSSLTQIGSGTQTQSVDGKVQFHSLTQTETRFVRLQIESYVSAQRQLRIGEVAFGGPAAVVPEPTHVAVILFGLAGAGVVHRRRRIQQED